MVDQVQWWRKYPYKRRGLGFQLFSKLPFADELTWTKDNMIEACRRYQAMIDERHAEQEREKEEAAKPKVEHCIFCNETASPERILVGNDTRYICEVCVVNAVDLIAKQRIRSGQVAPAQTTQ